jgi:hypothetical protein
MGTGQPALARYRPRDGAPPSDAPVKIGHGRVRLYPSWRAVSPYASGWRVMGDRFFTIRHGRAWVQPGT